MITAICVGLMIWLLLLIATMLSTKQFEPDNTGQCFLALTIIVSTCVVVQHFGSMLIGAFT